MSKYIDLKNILFVLVALLLSSCVKTPQNNCAYLPVVEDNTGVLIPKTHLWIKNTDFPKGIVPIVITVDSIPAEKMYAFADEMFDSIVDNSLDKNAFKSAGLLMVVSRNPELIQLRVGDSYDTYLMLKGITAGRKYLELQNGISKVGLDESCKLFLEECITEIENYRELSWFDKFRVQISTSVVVRLLRDLGHHCELFVLLFTWLCGLTNSWFISYLIIAIFIYFWGESIRRLLEPYLKRRWVDTCVDREDKIRRINIIGTLCRFMQGFISILITMPTLAAITILSNARVEDLISLEAMDIPYIEIVNWTNECYIMPSFGVLVVLVVVYYLRSIFLLPGLLSQAICSTEFQERMTKDPLQRLMIDAEMRNSHLSRKIKFVFIRVLRTSINSIEESSNPELSEENIGEEQYNLHNIFHVNDKTGKYRKIPYAAIYVNTHRDSIVLSFFVFLCASTFLTTPLIMYLIALWSCKFLLNLWKENVIYIKKKKAGYYLTGHLDLKIIWKEIFGYIILLILMVCIYVFTNPREKIVENINIKTEYVEMPMIEGIYFVNYLPEATPEDGATARVTKLSSNKYQMKVYSNNPIVVYDITVNEVDMSVNSAILGKGSIEYVKEIDKIIIKFSNKWEIIK